MNLDWKHLPLIVLAGVVGTGLGWLLALIFPQIDTSIGLRGAGAVWGGIAGMGFAVVAIVARAARDPNVGPARNFTQLHGMGSALLGRSELGDDGSYVTTEWFTIFWIPMFPVCRYRVTRHDEASTPFWTPYTIHEKLPVRLNDAARIYGITVLTLFGIVGLLYLVVSIMNAKH